jgi:hypothetical protein
MRPPAVPVRAAAAVLAPVCLLVIGMGVATHSVVRYEFAIVAVYCALAVLLAGWQLRALHTKAGHTDTDRTDTDRTDNDRAQADRARLQVLAVAVALVIAAFLHLQVPAYSYLKPGERTVVQAVFAGTALLVAAILADGALRKRRRSGDVALAATVIGYLIAAVMLIRLDPTPKIDVWVTLQQAADGILRGDNMYRQNWSGSPGVQDAFTYLPFTGLLLAPGRWLAGDVRWTLVVVTLLGVLAVRLLGAKTSAGFTNERTTRLAAAAAAALLLLLPGTATQVEQAWTEPLLMACLAGWALGVQRNQTVLAVVCLALGVASKQHLVVLLPILAAWPQFGPRKAVASAGLAGLFVLPWIIASPTDIWHDTVTTLVHFQPLIFADTLYIAAINDLSWTPPFWVTGAAVLLTLAVAVIQVRRRNPDLGTVLRWAALFLFVANLVNKQAFYNQYWLVAALVVISLAVPRSPAPLSDPEPVRPPVAAEA